jgi:methanogenic corrinoid protein MtbC1
MLKSVHFNFKHAIIMAATHMSLRMRVAAPYLKVCRRSDPKLNDCVIAAVEGLRPHLVTGTNVSQSTTPVSNPQVPSL